MGGNEGFTVTEGKEEEAGRILREAECDFNVAGKK